MARLSKEDYYKQRVNDPSLSLKQRQYAASFLDGRLDAPAKFRNKGSINNSAFSRGRNFGELEDKKLADWLKVETKKLRKRSSSE